MKVAQTLLQQYLLHPESPYGDQKIRISQKSIKFEKIHSIHLPMVVKLKNKTQVFYSKLSQLRLRLIKDIFTLKLDCSSRGMIKGS